MNGIRLSISHMTAKTLIRAIVAAIVGLVIGTSSVYAEWLIKTSVPGAGNVANAGTTGHGPDNYATGYSTANIRLYHIFAGVRLWHPPPPEGGSPLLQSQSLKEWFDSFGGATNEIFSIGYGDKATTRSTFRYTTSWHSSIYYTSFPDYSASCSNHWYYGLSC